MKRLNCTYEISKDKNYPWLLKHPKIKAGLAKFRTRQEALEWYMLLDFETAIWFQDVNRIFAGQLTIDNDEQNWYYYIKTKGFDGDATYEGICRELSINQHTFEINKKELEKRVKPLKEGEDFILISDPYTYFPADLEISKRKPKDYVDVEIIKDEFQNRIQSLEAKLNENAANAEKELEKLQDELATREAENEELKKIQEELIYKTTTIENVQVINRTLQEELAKTEAENEELRKRREKEEKESSTKIKVRTSQEEAEVKQIKEYGNTIDTLQYTELIYLNESDTVGAMALYIEKIKKILDNIEDKAISQDDYDRIKYNLWTLQSAVSKNIEKMPSDRIEIVSKLNDQLIYFCKKLIDSLTIDSELEDTPANQAYYYDAKLESKVPVSFETSYVLVDLYHVGFVPKDEYYYAIPNVTTRSTYSVTLVHSSDSTRTVKYESPYRETVRTYQEEVIEEIEVPEEVVEEEVVITKLPTVEEQPVVYEEIVEEPKVEVIDYTEEKQEEKVPANRSRWLYIAAIIALVIWIIILLIIAILAGVDLGTGAGLLNL